jgi:MFS superfamily sulfate permease-like transporter
MGTAQGILIFPIVSPVMWRADWEWGLPLIVLTVVVHVLGLGLINQRTAHVFSHLKECRHPTAAFAVVMGTTTLLVTLLHAIEAGIWAASYEFLGALTQPRSAILYSLSAITSYGHANLILEDHWQLMGAIEALNGWLLFGLTTAFLFGMLEKIWSLDGKGVH